MNISDKELENAMTLVISTLALLSEQDVDRVLQGMGDTVRAVKKNRVENVKKC